MQVFPSLLRKNDDNEVQAHKNRRQRLLSLQRTYSVNEVSVSEFCNYKPQVLIVIDDILTKGATTTAVIEQVAKNNSMREILKKKPIIRFAFASA
jgi:predicted amidophosphoribosyltransferase